MEGEVKKNKDRNRCLGCGIPLEVGEVCYRCLSNGLALTYIHHVTGKTKVIGANGRLYSIWKEE